MYIYHNVIDNEGENAREAHTFAAVRKAIDELSFPVGFVVESLNGNHVLVTADHGFLYGIHARGHHNKSRTSVTYPRLSICLAGAVDDEIYRQVIDVVVEIATS